MKNFLFHAITNVAAWLIQTINGLAAFLVSSIGTLALWMMKGIDEKKLAIYQHIATAEPDAEAESEALELNLLTSAQQVRDHAQESSDWTDNHTNAINAIGNALVDELGWLEEDVHVYMKDLVESIEGLTYGD